MQFLMLELPLILDIRRATVEKKGFAMFIGAQHLDSSQVKARDIAVGSETGVSIVGVPGSGKTTVLANIVQEYIRRRGEENGRIAVITQDRRAASILRNNLTRAIGYRPQWLTVNTLSSFAFTIVQAYAQARGRDNPELITGPEEDQIIAQILTSEETGIKYPDFITGDIRKLPGFRQELRNLITRSRELGLTSADMERLSSQGIVPYLQGEMWKLAAQVMDIYENALDMQDALAGSLASPDRLDHAQLVATAAHMLDEWDASGSKRPVWDAVLVDDIQNAPRSILILLRQLQRDGARIIVAGDPDSAVQGFRGGVASLPGDVCLAWPAGLGLTRAILNVRHRAHPGIHQASQDITQHIRIAGGQAQHRIDAYVEASSNRENRLSQRDDAEGGLSQREDTECELFECEDAESGLFEREDTECRLFECEDNEDTRCVKSDSTAPACEQVDAESTVCGQADVKNIISGQTCIADFQGLRAASFIHSSEEQAYVAAYIEELHQSYGYNYSDIAVCTRSRATHYPLRQTLTQAGITVETIGSEDPLKIHPVVRALLDLVYLATGCEKITPSGEGEQVKEPLVSDILRSPLIDLNAVQLQRTLRGLRAQAMAEGKQGYELDSQQLLNEAVRNGATSTKNRTVVALARTIQEIQKEYEKSSGQAERVMWVAWDSCKVAEKWQKQALSGEAEAENAGDNLDAVIQMFRIVQRMADRQPNVHIQDFLETMERQELPEDTIAKSATPTEAVALITPSSSQGREWKHVIIMGLQDGVWPNMRRRDALTATGLLEDIVVGAIDTESLGKYNTEQLTARIAENSLDSVFDDELRQLHYALTRASHSVLLTTTSNSSQQPSRLLKIMGFVPDPEVEEGRFPRTMQEVEEPYGVRRRPVTRLDDSAWTINVNTPVNAEDNEARNTKKKTGKNSGASASSLSDNAGGSLSDNAGGSLSDNADNNTLGNKGNHLKNPRYQQKIVHQPVAPRFMDMAEVVGRLRNSGEEGQRVLKELMMQGCAEAHSTLFFDEYQPTTEQETEVEQLSISPSSVESWLKSPLDAFLSANGLTSQENREASELGTLIHGIGETISKEYGDKPDLDVMKQMLRQRWPGNYEEEQAHMYTSAEYLKAEHMVEALYEFLAYSNLGGYSSTHTLCEAEKRVAHTFNGSRVSGTMDRLMETSSGYVVVDYKTGATKPSKKEAETHPQMQVYQWLLAQEEKPSQGAYLIYLHPNHETKKQKWAERQQEACEPWTLRAIEEQLTEVQHLMSSGKIPVNKVYEDTTSVGRVRKVHPLEAEGRMFS
ncbi:UrvD/REP family ATP-dependent DNA helicase [Actinotignum urinale]|uniref:UrvD/REP family ATP-dependent DNA helicase n=1 Tax=Actinotignum urinale TaxID=190146 RepID=UPI0012EC3181|nr:UrvD/REP family ATP-dependent DNA helicase [Actinotignum urinale]